MTQRGITAIAGILIVLNLTVFGLAAWKIWDTNHPKPPEQPTPQAQPQDTLSTTATSAKGAFSITFPTGWDAVLRVMDGDHFVVKGPEQPQVSEDVPARVQDIASFDGSSPTIFEVAIDDSFSPPDGDAIDFLAGQNKYLLSGRKYTYIYSGNSLSQERKNGDKDYVYTFSLGGKKELRVTYRVFSDDPTDNSKVVDAVVRSIHKLK